MPWKAVTTMEQKIEFVKLALHNEISFSSLCKRYNISRKTGYKWLGRYKKDAFKGLHAHSRRPLSSPSKTPEDVEVLIIQSREKYKAWGAEKIKCYLEETTKRDDIPSIKTISRILKRKGYITEEESLKHQAFKRFEHEAPNDLWQADFKGYIMIKDKQCHPLTVLDDHSRYSIKLKACSNQTMETVKTGFIECFRQYGLPSRMNFDNGSPWGNSQSRYTQLTLWLIRIGIRVSFSRPYHPQTNGKNERFHRTLKLELLQFHTFEKFIQAQKYFDEWRECYNHIRPHKALELKPPISRYRPSVKEYKETLEAVEYDESFIVRQVRGNGCICYKQKDYYIGKYLIGENVGMRPKEEEGKYDIYYCAQKLNELDLKAGNV